MDILATYVDAKQSKGKAMFVFAIVTYANKFVVVDISLVLEFEAVGFEVAFSTVVCDAIQMGIGEFVFSYFGVDFYTPFGEA